MPPFCPRLLDSRPKCVVSLSQFFGVLRVFWGLTGFLTSRNLVVSPGGSVLFARLAGRNVNRSLGLFGVALVFCLICPRLFSQTIQSNIQGEVFDQSGGAIAGATVTVTDVARGISRVLVTDS